MTGQSSSQAATPIQWWKPALFFLVVIAGLWYVKWQPYYGKAFTAAETHSIGKSILAQADANPWQAALDYAMIYFLAVWKAAVLGVILGSLIQVLIPRDWLLRTLGQSRFRGTLLGTRRQQVSMGGALAFWMGNPVLNPATLVFMGFVLGWGFAAIRLVAGLVMVLLIATLVQKWVRETPQTQAPVEIDIPEAQGGFFSRWGRALWTLFWSTIPVYILAVLVLGAARVWLFPHADGAVDNSLMWVMAMAVAGCLFVIPTAAEIPIVQTMMLAGMGTAPALALLMTLPAVSLLSLIMLRKAFPAKALWLTGAMVAVSGVIVGGLALLF
ncbi:TPA: permease [Escherichia coli]|uniref:permease n=1 Tax=Escherichia coli TaxID=562 RepID=UPI0002511217|nr:permease [Escherichia coli]EHY5935409.1 permease [Shigella sonnei]HDR9922525.1 permease [Escherichia coli 2254-75 (11a)]EEV6998812.1 permease [Escherichia coli]EEW3563479.1 permease [Escherichia coli]EFB2181439.1 permease [Escherichia coli]